MILRPLAVTAAFLAAALLPASAHAVLPSGNVVVNGDAESGPAVTNSTDAQPPPAPWESIPNFTAVVYGSAGFPSTAVSASINGGNHFFAGGPDNGFSQVSIAQQRIDLSAAAPELDRGNVQATLSADLGGRGAENDTASVTAVFTDANGQSVNGAIALEAVTPAGRDNETTLIRRTACTTLTPGAREAFVQIGMQRNDPPYNDGYADNVSVTLSTAACPASPDAPLEPPAPPEPGVSGNAEVVRGRILVKKPGSTEFQELRDERSIPVGSEVDARRGVVSLETAANNRGKTQKGNFYQGSFVINQRKGSRLITDLDLTGGGIEGCRRRAKGGEVTSAARKRRLWGNGRGRFRTRGRYATAAVRGTQWMMQDTCTATSVRVTRGSVLVRDLSKRRNVTVRAGRSYIARAPRR